MKKLTILITMLIATSAWAEDDLGAWSFGSYVDEFGDKTGGVFLRLTSLGKFSNSATTDSSLRVEMIFAESLVDNIGFRLYEYNSSNAVKSISGSNYIYCNVKDNNGLVFSITLYQREGWNYFRMREEEELLFRKKKIEGVERLKNIILKEEIAKFSCSPESYKSTKYKFSLDFKDSNKAVRQSGLEY